MSEILKRNSKLDRPVITSKNCGHAPIKVYLVFARLVFLKDYPIAVAWGLVIFVDVRVLVSFQFVGWHEVYFRLLVHRVISFLEGFFQLIVRLDH